MSGSANSSMDAIIINGSDNIAVCLRDICAPGIIRVMSDGAIVSMNTPAPLEHKVAWSDIGKREEVLKYAEDIGRKTAPVRKGDNVLTQNMTGCGRDML